MTRVPFQRSAAGSALVSTLLVIVVLSIIVVAFLQSMSTERQTARSYMNKYKAELAAQAAMNQAIAKILSTLPKTAADAKLGFTVWSWANKDTDPNFEAPYCGILTDIFDTSGSSQGVDRTAWLFSSQANISAPDKLASDDFNRHNFNAKGEITNSTKPKPIYADWVDVVSGNHAQRYAYWVSDEGGSLDITKVGNSGNTSKDTGKLADLKLSNIPDSEQAKIVDDTNRTLFKNLTPKSVLQIAPSLSTSPNSFTTVSKDVSTLINYGGMALQPRTNINSLFTNHHPNADQFVMEFDSYLSKALPADPSGKVDLYYSRKGALAGTVKRIAASVYDYISTDKTPTFSPNLKATFGNFPNISSKWKAYTDKDAYYGIKKVPMMNEFLAYYADASDASKDGSSKFSNNGSKIVVTVTRILELWNMFPDTLKVTNIQLRIFGSQSVNVFGGSSIPPSTETLTFSDTTIPPNGFVALRNVSSYTSDTTSTNPSTGSAFTGALGNATTIGLVLSASINDSTAAVIDAVYPVQLQGGPSNSKAGCGPGYSTSGETADDRTNIGQYLDHWAYTNYLRHTPGQANNTTSGSGGSKYQDMTTWFDRPLVGGGSSAYNSSPLSPPVYIKNGPLDYIGELGNIWDPSADLQDSAKRPRGGKTLVIGQFDPYYRIQNGTDNSALATYGNYLKRADAALLDVFTANDDPRVNINSPRPLTEPNRPLSILSGIFDLPTTDDFPQTAKPTYDTTAFEKQVISRLSTSNWKDARPFRNTNDLMTLGSTLSATPFVCGTSNFWSTSGSPLWKSNEPTDQPVTFYGISLPVKVTDGDDRSREEAFRRISNWVGFSSLRFHVHSAGQVLDAKQRQLAEASMNAIVTFVPNVTKNPSDGTTQSITYTVMIQQLASK